MRGGDGVDPQILGSGHGPSYVSPEWIAEVNARGVAIAQEREASLTLAKRDFPSAIRRLKNDLLENPKPEPRYYLAILDLDLHHGDFPDAYRVAAGVLSLFGDPTRSDMPQSPDRELLFRASLAASMMGEVYKGQREFCLKMLNPNNDSEHLKDFPQGDSPDDVACLSCLGIGGTDFLELALQLDPGDPWAACLLGHAYGDAFQYSKAIKVLESGLKRNDSGFAHDLIVLALRGYRYALVKVGDGNPIKIAPPTSSGIHP